MSKANANPVSTTTSEGIAAKQPSAWLNRNVFGMGLTSLLSDVGHEMVTTVLPGFLTALGLVEGLADGMATLAKLVSGWVSDRAGRRKPIAVAGYFLTGSTGSIFAIASGWPLVLVGRAVGWFGRGIRAPARNAILASSVPAESLGKAFGFERAGDTLGAILGPSIAVALLTHLHYHASGPTTPFRIIFLLTLIPGLACGLVFALLVKEK